MSHFLEIKDAWLDPGAMVTSGLLARIRDNPEALYEHEQGFARKAAAEGPDSTLHDDADLVIAVGADEVWHLEGVFSYSTNPAEEWTFGIKGPSGATGSVYWSEEVRNTMQGVVTDVGARQVFAGGSGHQSTGRLFWSAYVATSSTAGNVVLEWGGGGATGNADSFIRAHRMDPIDATDAFDAIADADVDANSPLKTSLMFDLRDSGTGSYQATRTAVIKSADGTPVNNSTVLVNDEELEFAVGANETWYVMLGLGISTNATAAWKFDLDVPAGATGSALGVHHDVTASNVLHDVHHTVGTPTTILNDSTMVWFEGVVITGGTAGDVTLEWAQGAADVSDTKVLAGSILIAHRMDPITPTDAVFGAISDADIDPESRVAETTEATVKGLRDNIAAIYNTTRKEIVKSVDESVTSATTGTTLQDDDELTFAVDANSQWAFTLALDIVTNNVADFKMQITTPDGADVGHYMLYHEPTDGGVLESHESDINTPLNLGFSSPVTDSLAIIRGYVLVGAVAGDITLQWAQKVGNANPTTVKQNSTLYARRIDPLD